jgi:very-short-patch-repair endonuclease
MGVEIKWHTPPNLWEKLKPLAREMRHTPTRAEEILWQRLRNRKVMGYKFRRQHAIDRFVLDFYCSELMLCIEVEGDIHQYTQEEDTIRSEFLESLGIIILRFSNDQIIYPIETVNDMIQAAIPARQTE